MNYEHPAAFLDCSMNLYSFLKTWYICTELAQAWPSSVVSRSPHTLYLFVLTVDLVPFNIIDNLFTRIKE